MQYLPSKKFLVIIVAVLLLAGGLFLASRAGNFGSNADSAEKFSYFSNLFKDNDKDSDSDGLKDWEETLWKTDPNNPDIDGDGVMDGEEVKAARNPLKPGPDDQLKINITVGNLVSAGANELTKTDILARDFFANFLSLYQSGKLDEQTKEKLTESFLAEINQEQLPDKYKISDIKIINDNSKEAMELYGNKLENVLNGHIIPENEFVIFERAVKNEDQKEIQKLEPIASAYFQASQEILAIEAPSSASEMHLNLINSFFNIAKCIEKMETVFHDPVNAITGLKIYQKEIQSSSGALKELRNRGILNNL